MDATAFISLVPEMVFVLERRGRLLRCQLCCGTPRRCATSAGSPSWRLTLLTQVFEQPHIAVAAACCVASEVTESKW